MAQIAEFDRLMAEVASGSEDAAWQLAETYTPHIIRAVRYSLSPKLRQKVDSLDFAQTLWASLLLRPADLSRLKTPDQLIGYLVAATRKKVCEKARRFKTQKCDIGREESLDQVPRFNSRTTHDKALYAREPSPSAMVGVRDRWRHILEQASDQDREIIRLRLEGCTFMEIGSRLQIFEQTARRAVRRLIDQFTD
jgi:RNA polymerase sigma factor (sigma-70 family)